MIVKETPKNKELETPGGDKWLKTMKGDSAGLPFYGFLDKNGKVLITSIRPAKGENKGGNIGHPMKDEEIAYFMKMVKKAAPRLSSRDEATLLKKLKSQ
jgi:hypothetical protein